MNQAAPKIRALIDGQWIEVEITEPHPVEQCRAVQNMPLSYSPEIDQRLEAAMRESAAKHERNKAALAANALMRQALSAVRKAAGLPEFYKDTRPPGLKRSLLGKFVTDDGFTAEVLSYKNKRDLFDTERRRYEERRQSAEVAAARQRELDIKLAVLIVRYGLPQNSDWGQVADALRAKNKYVDLAIAGYLTRGDWSEGFWRVARALARFKIETPDDEAIRAEWTALMEADDGRVFRDTAWNYDRVMALAGDKQLAEDALMAAVNAE